MKAAYDYNVLGKIQLAISNYLIVKELDMTQFIKNNFASNYDRIIYFSNYEIYI